ncbi:hypothetical protein E5288_WYG022694 [Bos mutus]|uniref:Uncharacterized protein n=1 Tax=Bos mutus TaxID=72004 RepID=A0A6B0R4G8_9CETA|nr:hypothetical protein [Bos mutus]
MTTHSSPAPMVLSSPFPNGILSLLKAADMIKIIHSFSKALKPVSLTVPGSLCWGCGNGRKTRKDSVYLVKNLLSRWMQRSILLMGEAQLFPGGKDLRLLPHDT